MAFSYSFRSPLTVLLAVVFMGVVFTLLRQRTPTSGGPAQNPNPCEGLTPDECRLMPAGRSGRRGGEGPDTAGGGEVPQQILQASEVCVNVGYLCAEVERTGVDTILRWPDGTSTIRVWVPEPREVSAQGARILQRAAANGIRVWHEFPFPLEVSTRSFADDPDITVEWSGSLGGNRLGNTEIVWSRVGAEFHAEVRRLQLVTHDPTHPEVELTPDQLQLVAAHEMGHALGLPHSDDPRDVMYPQNTAWRRTRRDFETMEALYRFPNWAIIRR